MEGFEEGGKRYLEGWGGGRVGSVVVIVAVGGVLGVARLRWRVEVVSCEEGFVEEDGGYIMSVIVLEILRLVLHTLHNTGFIDGDLQAFFTNLNVSFRGEGNAAEK